MLCGELQGNVGNYQGSCSTRGRSLDFQVLLLFNVIKTSLRTCLTSIMHCPGNQEAGKWELIMSSDLSVSKKTFLGNNRIRTRGWRL